MKAFWHGHSYTANPLGCAAALASFRLLDEHRPVFAEMEQWHLEHLAKLGDHPLVKKRRLTGTIAAFDIAAGPQNGYLNKVGEMIKKRSVEEGMLFRPLGNVMYLMPPYCTTESQLAEMYEVIDIILRELEEG
jgi:adenosylmethionine-8-amino-7-oxononanoate aminotransferase